MFGQFRNKEATLQTEALKFEEITYQSPPEVFSRLNDRYDHIYLLESVEGSQKLAESSFIGFNPKKIIMVKDGKTIIQEGTDKSVLQTDNPLRSIREEICSSRSLHTRFRLIGGAVGYISYDAIRYWEDLPHLALDDVNLPDIEMGIYDDGIVFDHTREKAYYYFLHENRLNEIEERLQSMGPFDEVAPISALNGDGVDVIEKLVMESLPPGPHYYSEDVFTDQPERFVAAEMVREQVFVMTHEEVPYATAVVVEEWDERPKRILIRARIYVETAGQKAIVIGHRGDMIKKIGTAARKSIEKMLGAKVYLDLFVGISPKWRRNERMLDLFLPSEGKKSSS